MQDKAAILSTALLSQQSKDLAAQYGMHLDMIPFINTSTILSEDKQQVVKLLSQQANTIVFTSVNAVRAIAPLVPGQQSKWSIYCISGSTAQAVTKAFGATAIRATANDAGALAQRIINDRIKNVIFFCGNIRMNTLPDLLATAGVAVREIEVYTTTEIPEKINNTYDGILFYSPSGVHSFFSNNTIDSKIVMFAIGATTASAINEKCANLVIMAGEPSKELLLRTAIDFFDKKATTIK